MKNFFLVSYIGGHFLCILGLIFKVKVQDRNILGFAKTSNIFGVCLIFFFFFGGGGGKK